MAKIRGGISQVEFSNNPTFTDDPTTAEWVVTIPGDVIAGEGLELPEPQVQTVQLADGRNVAAGYTVQFALRVKEISSDDLVKLKSMEEDDGEVYVRFTGADKNLADSPKLQVTIKRAILTRVTNINLASQPGLCTAIIEGNATGVKESDVIDTVVSL